MDALTAAVLSFMAGVFVTLAAERARRKFGHKTYRWSAYCPRCATAGIGQGNTPIGTGRCPTCGGTLVISRAEVNL